MPENIRTKQKDERRRAKRMAVRESFSFFLVIPKKMGMSRIYMRDISLSGISFWSDMVNEFNVGAELSIRLYTSPALYLPIDVKVVRASPNEIAIEFVDRESDSVRALEKFLEFLDMAEAAAVLETKTA